MLIEHIIEVDAQEDFLDTSYSLARRLQHLPVDAQVRGRVAIERTILIGCIVEILTTDISCMPYGLYGFPFEVDKSVQQH